MSEKHETEKYSKHQKSRYPRYVVTNAEKEIIFSSNYESEYRKFHDDWIAFLKAEKAVASKALEDDENG